MKIWKREIQAVSEAVKIELETAMIQDGLTQQEIGNALGVSHTTVLRWASKTDYQMHLPVFALAALTNPKFHTLVFRLLEFVAKAHGYRLIH